MYKGYKTYRSYINAKLHGLTIVICGDRSVLDNEISQILKKRNPPTLKAAISTTVLTDREATDLYNKLIGVAKQQERNKIKAKQIVNSEDIMTDGQRKAIISICRYQFNWKAESTFNYILKTIPELSSRVKFKDVNLELLYANITKSEADKIIKRLDMIKRKNEKK